MDKGLIKWFWQFFCKLEEALNENIENDLKWEASTNPPQLIYNRYCNLKNDYLSNYFHRLFLGRYVP